MTRKKLMLPIIMVLCFLMVLVGTVIWINKTFSGDMDDERKHQLNELAIQVSDTFGNALSFNQSYAVSAKQMFLKNEYATEDDIISGVKEISQTLDIGETGSRIVLIDQNGYCYDAEGKKGIWGDFDQISKDRESYTFISDSVTYEGTHWAFVEKLEDAVVTGDGKAEIAYVAILCPVETLNQYYISDSYDNVGETYILKENGTRMYDSVTEEDTIPTYNIYKALRSSEEGYGDSFDDVLATLEEEGAASGIYVKDGEKYCYSLTWHREYKVVILYLIPATQVASDTAEMVSAMTRLLIGVAVVILVLAGVMVYVVTKMGSERKLSAQKEKNMRELEEMNTRLKQMNKSLNDANRAAQSALAVAESANHAKSSFLSNMSHDIRTPLNAILGFQKLLDISYDKPEKVQEYSAKIAMSGKHLLALIDDILDMSRIESGKTTLNLAPFDLKRLVDELQTMMTPQTQNKEQSFLVKNEVGNLLLVGDQARLNQILTNLLSNAVKYTPKGGNVEFLTERISAPRKKLATIRFTVRDNGIGMEESFQKRIFEPFSREESALLNGITGTGLGMSITKNLVDLMGGIIMVESKKGKGSTLVVEISFRLADEADNERNDAAQEAEDLKDVLRGCRFLMAEDTAINAEILTELLQIEGASCDVAHNGKEAVERFRESEPGSYTAILMDVQMPIMDGYEATRRIRKSAHPEAQTIPIAALTANAFAEDVQKALEAGMNTHIAKPVDMNKLREFVATLKK